MASEEGRPSFKYYVAFAVTLVIVLAATGVWNPFPRLWDWVNRSAPLSTSDLVWQVRLGGSPKSVTVAGSAVVVEHRTTVEVRGLNTGTQLWEKDADWSAVAGEGAGSVVVTGKLLVKGYDVRDPMSGTVRRHDSEAVAVWTFRNALLDVRCAGAQDCTLSAWDPRGSNPLWRIQLPGVGFVLFADNPEVLGTRPLTVSKVDRDAGGPILMPGLIGFPIDGKVHVVDTATGTVVQVLELDRKDRVVVAGGRVLSILSEAKDGTCYFTVVATDPATGGQVWRQAGLNLRTADESGCVQRQDPTGQESVIVGVAADGREVLLDAYDGRALWLGAAGQKVVAMDSQYTLVRSADRKSIIAYELGSTTPLWTRRVHPDAQAALGRYAAVIMDAQPDRVIALDPQTGKVLLEIRSSARVVAVGPTGLILVERREMGFARFAGAGPVPGPSQDGGGGPGPGSGNGSGPVGPTCNGPKREQCAG